MALKKKDEKRDRKVPGQKMILAGVGVAAVLLIAGSIGLIGCSQKRAAAEAEATESQQSDMEAEKMREELNSISEYLTQLDDEIMNNQNALNQMAGENAELGEDAVVELENIRNTYQNLYAKLDGYEQQFSHYLKNHVTAAEGTNSGIVTLQTALSETKEKILETETCINDTLKILESNQADRQSDLIDQLTAVKNYITETEELIGSVEKSTQDALADLDQSVKEQYVEVVVLLEDMQADLGSSIVEEMTVIENGMDTLQNSLETGLGTLQDNVDVSVGGLKTQMESIHFQIAETQSEITDILASLDEQSEQQYQETVKALETAVNRINSDVNTAHDDLQELIQVLNTDLAENHKDTLNVLESMEGSMSDFMTSNLEQINSSFSSLNSDLSNYFSQVQEGQGKLDSAVTGLDTTMGELGTQLNTSVGELGTQLNTSVGQLGTRLDSSVGELETKLDTSVGELGTRLGTDLQTVQQAVQGTIAEHDAANKAGQEEIKGLISAHDANAQTVNENIAGKISEHNAEVQTLIGTLNSNIEQKLESVFQSVSSGKQLLASALLTKNVSVDGDATFRELYDAVLTVPQEVVIGEAQIPGEVEYEYHYHTGDAQNGGGCYTVEDIHGHVAECYVTCSYTISGCWSQGNYITDDKIHCPYYEKHSYCNGGTETKGEFVHKNDGSSHKSARSGTHLVTVCGITEGTFNGWKTGCGLADGQITGAHISYVQ